MRRAFIVGCDTNRYGKMEESAREAMVKLALDVIYKVGLTPKDIELTIVSNALSVTEFQGHVGPLVNNGLGIPEIPSMSIESACASGSTAFREGYVNVAGGFCDIVLVVGGEKVSHLDTITATSYFAYGADYWFESTHGVMFPGLYALMATSYMEKFGLKEETLGKVAIKNHKNGAKNPKAHFQKEITMEQYLSSMMVTSPLKLYDCCPFSDGASCAIIVSEDALKKYKFSEKIEIVGSARAGNIYTLQDREDPTRIDAATFAVKKALEQAGISQNQIDFVEVHDCFTIAEIIATEGLGFFKHGEGGKAVEEGLTELDGKIPVNPSGGLKAKGHPVGATGIGQVVEVFEQLLGRAGKRQVKIKNGYGMTHNVGATGGSCSVHIFSL